MTMPSNAKAMPREVLAWLEAHQPLLMVTHTRPDGDALGSLFGARQALLEHGLEGRAYVCEAVPETYESFAPEDLLVGGAVESGDFGGLLCLDCANPSRLGIPEGFDYHALPLPACNLDHHVDNHLYGELNLIDGTTAATAELLAGLFAEAGVTVSAEAATQLLIGIITDTGGFKHANTSAKALRITADLIEQGGDYARVIKATFYSEPPGLLKLKGMVMEQLQYAFEGRLVYFILTHEMLEACGVDERDTEDLIDVARTLRGIDVVCRMQEVEEGVRYSFRSQNPALHVNTVAHKLNGGGHAMAAGALMKGIDMKEAERLLHAHVGELLDV